MAALPFRMVPSLTILLNWCSTTQGKWTDYWPLWSSPVVVAPGNHPRGTGSSVMRRCRRQWELLHYSWDTRYVSTRRFSCLWPEKFSPLKYFHRCTEQRKLKHVKNMYICYIAELSSTKILLLKIFIIFTGAGTINRLTDYHHHVGLENRLSRWLGIIDYRQF